MLVFLNPFLKISMNPQSQKKSVSPPKSNIVNKLFIENPAKIFSYWKKPPVEEIVIPKFRCRWCDEEFLDDGSHPKFEKFDQTY